MATLDEENAALEAENAALEARKAELKQTLSTPAAGITTQPESGYGVGQFLYDVPMGISRAVLGAADIVAYPFVKGLQYAGADIESWGGTKFLEAGAPLLAEKLGVRPTTEVQQAVEFMTPVAPSKAKLATELGLGLASYLGQEAAQEAFPESPYAGLLGAIGAPAGVQTAAALGKQLTSAITPTAKVLLGSEEALKAAAQEELLKRAGPEGIERLKVAASMPSLQTGAGEVPLTFAEIAQTPSAAQFQQSMLSTPEGAALLQPALEKRQTALTEALRGFGITPQQGEMSIAMRDAAATAKAAKQLEEASLLERLGYGAQEQATTALERGRSLQESLMLRKEEVEEIANATWESVPGKTKIDASTPFNAALQEFANFGELAKADISGKAQRVIKKVDEFINKKNGIVTVDELQDLRSAAGRAMAEASGINPTEARLMRTLRENIDTAGLSYAYDPTVGLKGGLPGTDATRPDLESLTKLSEAIEATRTAKQTYSQGVVGDITAIRQFKPKLQSSNVIKKAVATPENIAEISSKVGFDSGEMTELRMELMSNLTKATKPTEYLGREKAKFKIAFGDAYATVEEFAQKKGQKAPLEEFSKVTDAIIPNKIFGDEIAAERFVKQFADSPVLDMGRSKFISERLLKSGNALGNLDKNQNIARKLFGADLSKLEKTLADLELSKAPAKLERQLASGNSITNVRATSLGAYFSIQNILTTMEKGRIPAAIVGSIPGWIIGEYAAKIASQRKTAIATFQAKMLANPQLLQIASAPPTEDNLKRLIDTGARLGFFAGKARPPAEAETNEAGLTSSPEGMLTFHEENQQLEQRVKQLKMELGALLAQAPKVQVGKQDVSIPVGEGYAPPNLVKAIMQVESSFNPKAVSPKGAAGLMQLMPGTARDLGVTDRFDPQQNVDAGSRYLAQQLKKFNSVELTAAAYNWGPRRVANAVAKLEAEGIPVTWENMVKEVKVPVETKNYVRKVTKLLQA